MTEIGRTTLRRVLKLEATLTPTFFRVVDELQDLNVLTRGIALRANAMFTFWSSTFTRRDLRMVMKPKFPWFLCVLLVLMSCSRAFKADLVGTRSFDHIDPFMMPDVVGVVKIRTDQTVPNWNDTWVVYLVDVGSGLWVEGRTYRKIRVGEAYRFCVRACDAYGMPIYSIFRIDCPQDVDTTLLRGDRLSTLASFSSSFVMAGSMSTKSLLPAKGP